MLTLTSQACAPLRHLLARPPPRCLACFRPPGEVHALLTGRGAARLLLGAVFPPSLAESNGEWCLLLLLTALLAAEFGYWFWMHEFQCNAYHCTEGGAASVMVRAFASWRVL